MALERLQKKFTRMLLQIMGIGSEEFFFLWRVGGSGVTYRRTYDCERHS